MLFRFQESVQHRRLGAKTIDALLDNNLIQDAADIYDLKKATWNHRKRSGKSAKNIMSSVNEKENHLAKVSNRSGHFPCRRRNGRTLAKEISAKAIGERS